MKLICYLSLGSPTLEQSKLNADHYVASGCDVIEVDFPAKDPYLDSAYIQQRMKQALGACSDYSKYMDAISEIKNKHPNTSFIVLTYESTIKEIGVQKFIDFCLNQHLKDIICVGDEYPEIRQKLIDSNLLVSSYVQYHLPKDEIELAKRTNGFIYLQAKSAGKYHEKYTNLKDIIQYLRSEVGLKNPIYCGVGISTPEDVEMVKKAGANGAFVGSTVLKLQDNPAALKQKIIDLKAKS